MQSLTTLFDNSDATRDSTLSLMASDTQYYVTIQSELPLDG